MTVSAETTEWSELSEISRHTPSPLAFRALGGLLETWSAADRDEAFAFAEAFLSAWPDETRLAPWSWCKAVTQGHELPAWRLVRSVELHASHLTKGEVSLAKLAERGAMEHVTQLLLPSYSEHANLTYLHHRHARFPALARLVASDGDALLRGMTANPFWERLTSFSIGSLSDDLFHRDASHVVPALPPGHRIRHLTLRALDLVALWEASELPQLDSVGVFIRSPDEARALASRPELSKLVSLSIAFRCGFCGSAPLEPGLGNVIEPDELAARELFGRARLGSLRELRLVGYRSGYWGREGMGAGGIEALVASGLLGRLEGLRLEKLPLGDVGVALLAGGLSEGLVSLELVDVYCKGAGARALATSACFRSLRRLDLSANRIDADGVGALAEVEAPGLRRLDLSGPAINPYYFDVGQQPFGDAGATLLANGTLTRQLEELSLGNTFLGDAGLDAVFRGQGLRSLELSDNAFSAEAMARIAGSRQWSTLEELGLRNCRLDDAAVAALARVSDAPALRSLDVGYNAIGPSGASALAAWPLAAQLWRLDLHDAFIGDEGLLALARSPHLARLVELDLEQDCWNSRGFDFGDEAAEALAASPALGRLDAIFSGRVDEYHGGAYSPGFSIEGIDRIVRSPHLRPAARASCTDFSGVGDWLGAEPFSDDGPLDEHDFRSRPRRLNEEEAAPQPVVLQAVTYAGRPPRRGPDVPSLDGVDLDLAQDDPFVIEGLAGREPAPRQDHALTLRLPLRDEARPLSAAAPRLLASVLDGILRASGFGTCESGGSGSEKIDGEWVETEASLNVSVAGAVERVLPIVRDASRWMGAPASADLRRSEKHELASTELPFDLEAGEAEGPLHLELGCVRVARFDVVRPGHRFDPVALDEETRSALRSALRAADAGAALRGWAEVGFEDGGALALRAKGVDTGHEVHAIHVRVERLSPSVAALVHRLMVEARLMLWPLALAADERSAASIDVDWPRVEIVRTPEALHAILAAGARAWWAKRRSAAP